MAFQSIVWDLEDDPEGNVQHIALNGITSEEVEDVFENPDGEDISRSSGRPVIFGETSTGKYIMVVYDVLDEDTVYPVTAYGVPPRS